MKARDEGGQGRTHSSGTLSWLLRWAASTVTSVEGVSPGGCTCTYTSCAAAQGGAAEGGGGRLRAAEGG